MEMNFITIFVQVHGKKKYLIEFQLIASISS